MPTALITGITGQDGSYLAELLLEKGYRVVGIARSDEPPERNNVTHLGKRVELIAGDLGDQQSLLDAVEHSKPDEVYNLAARSFPQDSFGHPVLTGDLVGLGVARLLEAVTKLAPKARVFQASSSELFGRALESPQNEMTSIRPRSPYGVAKAYGHWMIAEARESRGLFAVSGILFNHESPRRGLEFVSRKVTNAVARIHHGIESEVTLGDLDARRDWGFAGDYVDAMWRMLQHHKPMDFVIGTGKSWSVRDLCETAFGVVGRDYRDYVKTDPRFMRPPEAKALLADPTLARKQLGWRPRVEFPEMIRMMVEADLSRVGGQQ